MEDPANTPSRTVEQPPEQQHLAALEQKYSDTLQAMPEASRYIKEQQVLRTLSETESRFKALGDFQFGAIQKAILKLKLARHFQRDETCDVNTLVDALVETPRFLQKEQGSIRKLFEVHEVKTLQKIAELRKKRAEMTGKEQFNPWEALFATTSGKYYLARLLNMPHLQEESAYMKHCVGTSTSYVNRMKRGEIEILSFRKSPTVNPNTQQLEGDEPIITIEYNLKTGVIEQLKKAHDQYLSKDDPYFADVLDVLAQLRTTTTDTGKLRTITHINASELVNISASDYHVITTDGEVSVFDIPEGQKPFILRAGKFPNLSQCAPKQIAHIVNLITQADRPFTPEHIAATPNQITESTKVYIGPLSQNIFHKLAHVEHIYTNFPEGKLEKITLNQIGGQDGATVLNLLQEKFKRNGSGTVPNGAQSMHVHKDGQPNKEFEQHRLQQKEDVRLVRLSVRDIMGEVFWQRNSTATTKQIFARAQERGLDLCPPEVGAQLWLQDKITDWTLVGMKPIRDSGGNLNVFNCNWNDDGPWLGSSWARPDYAWRAGRPFVFRVRNDTG